MKYNAFLILSVFFFGIILDSCAKDRSPMNKQNSAYSDSSFIFDRYLIDPINKTISIKSHWEKDEMVNGRMIHSWGDSWELDRTINFDSTSLYINDDYIAFKEHYIKPKKVKRRSQVNPITIDGYKYVNSLYKKDGKFYWYISSDDIREIEIPQDIDFENLTPMTYSENMHGFYLYDDKGLYFMREYPTKSIKKIASAKNKVPIIHTNYCEFDGNVYQNEDLIDQINKLTIFDVSGDGSMLYVTDGKKILTSAYIHEPIPFVGMDKWTQITRDMPIIIDEGNVYLPSFKQKDPLNFHLLFDTPTGFVALSKFLKEAPIPLKEIFIVHEGKYEPLDIKQYQLHHNGFYTYKGNLYRNGMLIENDFDGSKIRGIRGIKDCFCDGKQLAYQSAVNQKTGRIEFKTVPIADINNLRVVHQKLLTDGINFYQIGNDSIEVTPLTKFPFNVVIDLSTPAYSIAENSILEDQIQTIYKPE